MSKGQVEVTAPNAYRLLYAGFVAILAAGVGFAIRGGILDNWGTEYGFTQTQLGVIGGAGFTGFCFGIMIGGVIVDKIGYGWLVIAAFGFHVVSAFVTFGASAQNDAQTNYNFLYYGTFLFAVANGTLEAVANPLVATLFPKNRTHYLNILHASWPAGMVLGGIAGWTLDDQLNWPWKWQLALYLIPTVLYGLMFLGQKMPKSEASAKGLKMGQMFKDVGLMGGAIACALLAVFFTNELAPRLGPDYASYAMYGGWGIGFAILLCIGFITNFSIGSWLLFVLFVTHAMVGAVELGTDGWIQNITGNILTSSEGKILFVFTSMVMFGLRFCADFIEKRIGLSPIGLLFVCAILACIGLNLTSMATTFFMAMLALTVYAFGKTFFWPTMLAVASDRFPSTGAVAISLMGGIGMMSAGLLGSPGLGYLKDHYSGEALQAEDAQLYGEYKAEEPSSFLFFPESYGLDGAKLGAANEATERTEAQQKVLDASIKGDRKTLKSDSLIPATMAVVYLLLALYFKSIGGYKPLSIDEEKKSSD